MKILQLKYKKKNLNVKVKKQNMLQGILNEISLWTQVLSTEKIIVGQEMLKMVTQKAVGKTLF